MSTAARVRILAPWPMADAAPAVFAELAPARSEAVPSGTKLPAEAAPRLPRKPAPPQEDTRLMKALVFKARGKSAWEDRPRPKLQQATDAIVRITRTSICAVDLRILDGELPGVAPGRVLGHEGVGVVEELGASVLGFRPGDKVLLSCITSCGICRFCRKGLGSHCRSGGWLLGNSIDGTQAEYVRVPHAEASLHRLPVHADAEAMVMLSDLLPTSFECGVLGGKVQPADTVAIVGAGPVGLAALLTAQFFAPAEIVVIDGNQKRLDVAQRLGATRVVDSSDGEAARHVHDLTSESGVDVAIDTDSTPESFALCQSVLTPGGRIAHVGMHGQGAHLRLEQPCARNITLTAQCVNAGTTPTLLKMVQSGHLEPAKLVTHQFDLAKAAAGYRTLANSLAEGALKVILRND